MLTAMNAGGVQITLGKIQLEFLRTTLDCSRNLCRQDDGVPLSNIQRQTRHRSRREFINELSARS